MDQGEWGRAARQVLRELIPVGTIVKLESDVQKQDRYGRTLAYVYLPDGRQANELMVRTGYAEVLVYPPNVRHVDAMRRARALARSEGRGLWAESAFACTPRDHRAKRCK
jgi:micrococcal nuclease